MQVYLLFILWAQVKTHVTKFLDPALSNVTTTSKKNSPENKFLSNEEAALTALFLFFTVDDDDPYVCMCRAQSWCHEVCTKFGPQSPFTLFITSCQEINPEENTRQTPKNIPTCIMAWMGTNPTNAFISVFPRLSPGLSV